MPLTWHSLFHTVEGIAAVGTIALAAGTLTVALVTFLTARRTRTLAEETARLARLTEEEVKAVTEQADAAREEVEVSRAALQANIKPTLIDRDVPVGFETDSTTTTTTVQVAARNVGAGLALIQQAMMHWDEPGAAVTPTAYGPGAVSARVVPPNEGLFATFPYLGPSERVQRLRQMGKFWVDFDYVDASGKQAETTRLVITKEPDDTWHVSRVELFHEGDTEPYVSSG